MRIATVLFGVVEIKVEMDAEQQSRAAWTLVAILSWTVAILVGAWAGCP